MKIRRKKMKDGNTVTIHIREANDQYKTFFQEIVAVYANDVTVISNRGKRYNVMMSDKVRMTMTVEVGDMAEIMPLENGWLVVNIDKVDKMPTDETAVTTVLEKLERRRNRYILEGRSEEEFNELEKLIEEEEKKETERQLREFEDLLGGY